MRQFRSVWMLTLTLAACVAVAQPHGGDVVLTVTDGHIVTNAYDGVTTEPWCLFTGAFGGTNQTNDPGFDSLAGTFPANAEVGFTIRRAVRRWNGADFSTIPPERIAVSWGPLGPVESPAGDTPVQGFTLNASSNGSFHYHYTFRLTAPASPGAYLLELELWSTHGAVGPSEPFWLVFNKDLDDAEFQQAAGWALDFVSSCGAGCPADFNGDTVVNTLDFVAFLNAFVAGDAAADFNGDTAVNTLDFVAFLNAFVAGC